MNRLQKKCVIATAGLHLLLLTILIVGPAFFSPRNRADDSQVLDVIPANLVDAAVNSGVLGAQPPPPAPSPQQPQPPPPLKPAVTPATVPAPEKIEREKPAVIKPDTEQSRTPKIELHPVTHNVPNVPKKSANDDLQKRAAAIRSAIRNLKKNLSPSTTIDMPGNSSAAYANYAQVVKSIYEQAWTPPDETASDDANTKVTVTIANDGTVVSARIIEPSDDASVDASVQKTLERVTFIAPFPEGATEKERDYTINFNLKAKRLLE